jgi:hypothetical protein
MDNAAVTTNSFTPILAETLIAQNLHKIRMGCS